MPVLVISHILEADSLKLTILPIISFFLAAAMIIPAKFAYKKISEAHAPFLLESSFSFFNVAFLEFRLLPLCLAKKGLPR